jgi:ribosomal protein S18 acetylase RimI-like enzyme
LFEFIEEIMIRKARLEDKDSIVRFQILMAEETENMALDSAVVTKGVGAVFADPAKGTYYVAEMEGKVVGVLVTMPEWSDWRNGTVLWLHSLYVLPEFRGQGLYSLMYGELKKIVEQSSELRGIRLYVDKRNTKAQAIYKKHGMTAEHYDLYEWLKG